MKTKLTLQEKLRDLRDERKLKLQDVADATDIPLATLGRIESNDDIRAGYQDIATLSKFYGVSTDYLVLRPFLERATTTADTGTWRWMGFAFKKD